jgi:glycerol-3-phosphate O-acyltransferase
VPSPVTRIKRLLARPIRLPRVTPFVPSPEDPAIFWFNGERDDIVREVVRRVTTRLVESKQPLEYVLNEAANEEAKRLHLQKDDEAKESLGFWKGIIRRVGKMGDGEKLELLKIICDRMAKDIAGNFDPRVYKFATKVVPHALTGVLKPSSIPEDIAQLGARFIGEKGRSPVDDMMRTEGDVARIKKLSKRGTLVFVPTHSSNLDSVALGYALMRDDMPPVVYGAGKNLFSNPIVSFFMHNLGAYRVDRRIRAALYKDVLKTYSCVMIERGYHSLFFPGGTRSRSGMVERRLKLGLAGTAVEAFAQNRVRGLDKPVFFVPTTINYALVLEAETLVEDWLKEAGRARYIIEDDEFSQLDRWIAFFRKLSQVEAPAVVRFGDPIDPFGNPVDDDGRSVAPDGRTIDPGGYVMRNGKPVLDARRDAAYTREMGHLLVQHYERDSVMMGTQVVSHVLFRRLVRETPGVDLFGRLRQRSEVVMSSDDARREVGEVQDRLRAMEARGEVRLSEATRGLSAEELVDRVVAAFVGYHRRTILTRTSDGGLSLEDPTMLLYYQNRMIAYAERVADERTLPAAREIARMGLS